MKYFLLIIGLVFFGLSSDVSGQDTTAHATVAYYFEQIPDSCFYLCNWREYGGDLGVKHIDTQNRSLSFRQYSDDGFPPSFQMAIFSGRDEQAFVVVSNQECEAPECLRHDSFFFLHREGQLMNADSIVLPNLDFSAFYDKPADAELLNQYPGYGDFDFVLHPEKGEVTVELLVCDYLQFDYPEVTDEQYDGLVNHKKTVTLHWNKHRNRFETR
ncbi:hypothetical protein [Lewinella sp. W8]|uniref:hypothetical protein n=1 Tax=Lewinella sp. W8 TaxID=2528208 RepID=UPI00106785CB|nr:hypothetical protein [Lewinella sp. W8]MTB53756.1 hypothetical protein [Lewinella sp. W8]